MVHKEDEDKNKKLQDEIPCIVIISPQKHEQNDDEEMKNLLQNQEQLQNQASLPPPPSKKRRQRETNENENDQHQEQQHEKEHSCSRTSRFNQWIPLSSFGGRQSSQLPPFSFWVRPLCCNISKGCDCDDVTFVDKICFPEDPADVIEGCCQRMCFSNRAFGYAVVRDNRSENQKWKKTMENPRKSPSFGSSIVSFFSRHVFNRKNGNDDDDDDDDANNENKNLTDSENDNDGENADKDDNNNNNIPFEERIPSKDQEKYNPDEIPVPPNPNQSSIVAYAIVKIQPSEFCSRVLQHPMCKNQQRQKYLWQNACLDLQSVAVTPAFRCRGLAEYVIRKSVQRAWSVVQKLKRKWGKSRRPEKEYLRFFAKDNDKGDFEDDDENEEELDEEKLKKEENHHHHHHHHDNDCVINPNAVHLTLCVRRNNERAINLYRKLGFNFESTKMNLHYNDRTPMDKMGTWVDFSLKQNSTI